MVRDDEFMEDDQMMRLCVLERMRFGYSEPEATLWVQGQLRKAPWKDADNGLWAFAQRRAYVFLDGESGNTSRDGIRFDAPDSQGEGDEAPAE